MWKPLEHVFDVRLSLMPVLYIILSNKPLCLAVSALSVVLVQSSAHVVRNAVARTLYFNRVHQDKSVIEHWPVEEKLYRSVQQCRAYI